MIFAEVSSCCQTSSLSVGARRAGPRRRLKPAATFYYLYDCNLVLRPAGILPGLGKGILGFLFFAVLLEEFPQVIPAFGVIGLQLHGLA